MTSQSLPLDTSQTTTGPLHWLIDNWSALFTFLFTSGLLAAVFFFNSSELLSSVQDDCYYYIKIAQNIVGGHGSTFNQITATNGYHPLWMLVISLFAALSSSLRFILLAISVCEIIATVVTCLLCRRVLLRFTGHSFLPDVCAVLTAAFSIAIYRSGMEVILTIPLALWLMDRVLGLSVPWTPKQAALTALLASAVVLSRLDSIMLVGLIGLFLIANREFRTHLTVRHVVATAIGFLPVAAYVLSNKLLFGTLMPVSGMAKQLRISHGPSVQVFTSILRIGRPERILIGLVVVAIISLPFALRRLNPVQRAVTGAALLFPVVQFCVLSMLSDWPIWSWYFYSFVIAMCAGFALLCSRQLSLADGSLKRLRIAEFVMAGVCGAYLCHLVLAYHRDFRRTTDLVAAGQQIARFSETHPGTYAMGDRSGIVGMLVPDPLIQTEGLVMDKQFLGHLQRQDDLLPVLANYGVKYYVVTLYPGEAGIQGGCLAVKEPYQAGPTANRMTGEICGSPVAAFNTNEFRTLIFQLKSE